MYKFGSITSHLSLRDKIFALDLYVVFGVFVLRCIPPTQEHFLITQKVI